MRNWWSELDVQWKTIIVFCFVALSGSIVYEHWDAIVAWLLDGYSWLA
jgi:hypothetical protein